MQCEVIVVGAGIGGLTTAALLAARGVDVCLCERQSIVGGCVANFSHLGYTFDPTFGAYSGWETEGTWPRIFAELPIAPPPVTRLAPNYIVRLPDGRDVSVSSEAPALEQSLAAAFPNCAEAAIRFLREMRMPIADRPVADLLAPTSGEFRLFIEAQLQMFAQCSTEGGSPETTAEAMQLATGALWSIDGGAQALAERLAESFRAGGGALRLNSPVLRLAYATDGQPAGVDLLNGERVIAARAIVSNLTIWDTYGKLIGPGRTPREVARQLKQLSAWGTYQMFLGLDQTAARLLPGPRTLLVYGSESNEYDPEQQQLMLRLSETGSTAPEGKRALTAVAFSQPEEWFSFHEDHSWHEERDQGALEVWWSRLHQALPELGDAVEVIETSTPQTMYESTRRKFGMVGTPHASVNHAILPGALFPNLYLVGDTVAPKLSVEGVALSALAVADQITK